VAKKEAVTAKSIVRIEGIVSSGGEDSVGRLMVFDASINGKLTSLESEFDRQDRQIQ
jgi:hypothetical protein